jgi:hypothetical protein
VHAKPLRIESESTAIACICQPKPAAVSLLSQVVARLHGLDVPVVQFIQVTAGVGQTRVARDFAEASLTRLGRTLIASLHEPETAKAGLVLESGSATVGRRRTRKPANDTPDIIPDATVQGLYHTRIGAGCGETNQISQVPPAVWLGEARLDFRLLVIDCGPLERNPAAVELASRCHGSILIVASGATRLPQIRAAAQQVQIAGGTLLGSVLFDTPPVPRLQLPGWGPRLQSLRHLLG